MTKGSSGARLRMMAELGDHRGGRSCLGSAVKDMEVAHAVEGLATESGLW